jgi:hypothetical protein
MSTMCRVDIERAVWRILDRGECLEMLGTTNLGRIGISWRAMPVILPVHFALERGRILVATWDDSVLARSTLGTVVAFEAEGPLGQDAPTWSVMVNGVADHCDTERAAPPPGAWPVGPDRRLVSISIEHVSGRRLVQWSEDVRPWSARADQLTIGP